MNTSLSEKETISPSAIDPHTTKWSNVNLTRFSFLIVVASTLENATFYPFYMLKTREQSDRRHLTFFQSFKVHLHTVLSNSAGNRMQKTRSLFRGFWFSNLTSMPISGLYLGAYVYSKDHFNASNNRTIRFYAPLIAGCLADAVCILLYVPSDVIVQRLQIADSPYKSSFDAIKKIYKTEGIKGYYRGFTATFMFTSTYSASWWMVYEKVKSILYRPTILPYLKFSSKSNNDKTNKTQVHRMPQIAAGFAAGIITSIILNPIDVVKTRIQTYDNQSTNKLTTAKAYKTVFHGLSSLVRDEGIHGLLKGLIPKLLSRGPLSAMSAFIFEILLYYSRNDL